MNHIKNKNVGYLILLFYPSLCLLGKGYEWFSFLIYISSLLYFITKDKSLLPLKNNFEYKLYGVMAIIFVLSFLPNFIVGTAELSSLDKPSRFLLGLLVIPFAMSYRPSIKAIQISVMIGAVIAVIMAAIQVIVFDKTRAFVPINDILFFKGYMPIQSGNIAVTLGLISLSFLFYNLAYKHYSFVFISLVGTLSGLIASGLSGSRGGWLAIPVIILYLIWQYRSAHFISVKNSIVAVFLLMGSFMVANATTQGSLTHRIEAGIANTIQYSQTKSDEQKATSEGVRLALWESAIITFKEFPIFGSGKTGQFDSRTQQVEKGLLSQSVYDQFGQSHAHNEYLEALSVRGIVGLLGLLSVFAIPLWILKKPKDFVTNEMNILRQIGVVVVISVAIFGFTQCYFYHNSGVTFYSVLLAIFIGWFISVQQKEIESFL